MKYFLFTAVFLFMIGCSPSANKLEPIDSAKLDNLRMQDGFNLADQEIPLIKENANPVGQAHVGFLKRILDSLKNISLVQYSSLEKAQTQYDNVKREFEEYKKADPLRKFLYRLSAILALLSIILFVVRLKLPLQKWIGEASALCFAASIASATFARWLPVFEWIGLGIICFLVGLTIVMIWKRFQLWTMTKTIVKSIDVAYDKGAISWSDDADRIVSDEQAKVKGTAELVNVIQEKI